MKRLRPNLAKRCESRDKQAKTLQQALDTLDQTVAKREAEFGKADAR